MDDDVLEINLKILSPSTEVKGDINLPSIAATTTISELRARLQNEIETRPAVERMRLIYRGRVVANDSDSLINIFGLENIRTSKDQTLHLVLRELPQSATDSAATAAPRSSTAPPNPFRPVPNPPETPTPTVPLRPAEQVPRPNTQPPFQQHPPGLQYQNHHNLPPNPPVFAVPGGIHNPVLQQHIGQLLARTQGLNAAQGQDGHLRLPRDGSPAPGGDASTPSPGAVPTAGPGHAHPPGNTTRIIRHESIGPNGERWTYTVNNTSITIPAHTHAQSMAPRPFPHPPGFALPARPLSGVPAAGVDQLLTRTSAELQQARQEMENVRVLLQRPGGQARGISPDDTLLPPAWRIDRIRLHLNNITLTLDSLQHRLAALSTESAVPQTRDLASMQQTAADLRSQAADLRNTLGRLQAQNASNQGSTIPNGLSSSSSSTPNASQQTSAAQAPIGNDAGNSSLASSGPELFILSSPQGPVGILFDQRGTYSTAPMVPTLPFQAFTQQFSANRQILSGLGQQLAHNNVQLRNQIATAQPANNAQPATTNQPNQERPQNQNQNQVQNQVQNQNQALNQAQPQAPDPDRVMVMFGHAWLIVKLAFFVYFFAGGGSWYRPMLIGGIAAAVYLANLGMFEGQFDGIRRHFEGLLGLIDQHPNRANAPRNNNGRAAQRNPTPEEAAQRLVQEHHERRVGWARETFHTVERAFALFVASLWPGIGERMVQAQEERERAERAAEEERARQEEEKRNLEAQQAEEEASRSSTVGSKAEIKSDETNPQPSSSKGKERAEYPVDSDAVVASSSS
ncbi:hypothetical protein BU24DRAFT_454394 [Aaosphaeria arxii CBS 175.79]|uniref:Ubiquitin-like domain-containing protein n=1 Tax=Aaosphaeria arxii CBS 175.79 TaxID=1450172 RepID=A0A6A5XDA2_9PLEO|nr:uncharacterized protein BU24DRAFT_454394 [Aaosphaeria arxii CBS 175.79]KAF2010843.1 hypothetical protein BU24DRAFT_454394 [Aaosphaeria arxii CBS 175.79]